MMMNTQQHEVQRPRLVDVEVHACPCGYQSGYAVVSPSGRPANCPICHQDTLVPQSSIHGICEA